MNKNITIILLDNTKIPDRKVYNALTKNINNKNDEIIVIDITGKEYLIHKNMIYWQETLDKINSAISNSKNDKILLLNHLSDVPFEYFNSLKQTTIENDVCLYHKNNDYKFLFNDNIIISFDKNTAIKNGGFAVRKHYIKNFCNKINQNKIKHVVYPRDLCVLSNRSVYENFSVIGFFKDNTLYHSKLKKLFNDRNIYIVNLSDKDCYLNMINFISKTKNDKIIMLSMSDSVFDTSLFSGLNNEWKTNSLNVLSNVNIKKYTWNKNINHITIGFDKKFINNNSISGLNIYLFRKYLLNLFKNNVVNISPSGRENATIKVPDKKDVIVKKRSSVVINHEHEPPVVAIKKPVKNNIVKKNKPMVKTVTDIFSMNSIGENKIIRNKPGYQRINMVNDIKTIKYKPCVCMCLYSRPHNLKTILDALDKQTYKNFEFFIWNNKPDIKEWLDYVVNEYNQMDITVFHANENKGSYARLLIPYKTENNPIIYFDDDRIPQKDFVEYCLERYIKFPFAIQSSWAFQIRNGYWKRTKIEKADVEVDYCGTGGMVLDRSLFNDNRVVDIPDEYKNIEDLWLNFIARRYHNKPLISMENRLNILKDDKDQFSKLSNTKTELFNYIRKKGYKLVSDIDKHPKISIIVVSYNRWALTKKCIDSVIKNTPVGIYELVVVDNKSTDETIYNLQKLKKENKIHKLILNNNNYQLGKGFNIGYKNCSKNVDYIMTLNNDHFVMNGWYYNVLAAFKNKDIDFVASTIRGGSFHFKKEIIDKDSNCRFLVIDGKFALNNKNSFVKDVINGNEIGEGLVFKAETIFRNKIKWSEDFPNKKWRGSYHARMAEHYLKPLKMKGVELGRPCVLWQKSGMQEYNKYYCDLFTSRHKKMPNKDYQFDVIQDKQEYYRWTNYLSLEENKNE